MKVTRNKKLDVAYVQLRKGFVAKTFYWTLIVVGGFGALKSFFSRRSRQRYMYLLNLVDRKS
jgi:hypothetical protein